MRLGLLGLLTAATVFTGCGLVQVRGIGGSTGSASAPQPQGAGEPQSAAAQPQEQSAPADAAIAAATKAWDEATRFKDKELEALSDFSKATGGGSDQTANNALALLTGKKDVLDAFRNGCREGRFKGERNGFASGQEWHQASVACPLVENYEAVLKKAIHVSAVGYAESLLRDKDSVVKDIETKGLIGTDVALKGVLAIDAEEHAYIDSFVKKYFDAIGESVPAELHAKVDEQGARRKAAIEAWVEKTVVEPRKGNDPAAEHAIKEANLERKLVVKRAWMTSANWEIETGQYGNIVTRYKNGRVLVAVKDAPYCMIVRSTAYEKYAGGGTYAQTIETNPDTVGEPAKCQ